MGFRGADKALRWEVLELFGQLLELVVRQWVRHNVDRLRVLHVDGMLDVPLRRELSWGTLS